MFAPTSSLQSSGNQSNQEHKEKSCPHGHRWPVVGGEINTVQKKCKKLNIVCHKNNENCGSLLIENYSQILFDLMFLFCVSVGISFITWSNIAQSLKFRTISNS